jgi:peptidyl-prolyl cis-trans isomerase SurA
LPGLKGPRYNALAKMRSIVRFAGDERLLTSYTMRYLAFLVVVAVLGAIANPAAAQREQRIAAIVNDEVVSLYDLEARMHLVIASSGLNPTPEIRQRLARQVLRGLIDERLRMQEARRRNVEVTETDMERAVRILEDQNNIPPGGLDQFLESNGIPRETLMSQIRGQIAWGKLVNRQLRPRVTIGDDEIDEMLARIKERQGQVEYRIFEILLTIDSPDQEPDIRRTAARLVEELRAGARFDGVAQQFSQAASASVGGDLGWIPESALSDELRSAIDGLNEGGIAGPIQTPGGLQIVLLESKRRAHSASADDTQVTLRQIMLPLSRDPSPEEIEHQTSLARAVSETVRGCDDMTRAAEEVNMPGSPDLGVLRLRDLADTIRNAIDGLPVGQPSEPIPTPAGVAVMMVCERSEDTVALPDRIDIEEQILDMRLDMMARRYMRDIRNAAVVDLRV